MNCTFDSGPPKRYAVTPEMERDAVAWFQARLLTVAP